MSNNAADEAMQARIDALFVNPRIGAAVTDIVVRNRPPGWGRRSQSPYFKEPYGRQMLEVLDTMMKTKQDVVFSLERFPHKNLNTIYLMVNQSIRYVLERFDTADKRYARFLEMVTIRKVKGMGVRISIGEANRDRDVMNFKPVFVDPKCQVPMWKDMLDKWLEESSPGDEPLLIEGIILTSDEIRDLKVSFAQVKNVMANVTAHSIKAIKIAL